MQLLKCVLLMGLMCGTGAFAQSQIPTVGTLVQVTANGQVTSPNDEATVTFGVDERDANKAAAASKANQKMKQGMEILRRQDPSAKFKSGGYSTFAVFREEKPNYEGERVIIGWRVMQNVVVTTKNLDGLPTLVAAAQKFLAVEDVDFHVSSETSRKLDDQRIAATYRNLNERIASIAAAMGRKVSDTVLETVDFDGAGDQRLESVTVTGSRVRRRDRTEVPEPSFEPGETTINMKLVGKVRFK
jgi:uncharacterized protein